MNVFASDRIGKSGATKTSLRANSDHLLLLKHFSFQSVLQIQINRICYKTDEFDEEHELKQSSTQDARNLSQMMLLLKSKLDLI